MSHEKIVRQYVEKVASIDLEEYPAWDLKVRVIHHVLSKLLNITCVSNYKHVTISQYGNGGVAAKGRVYMSVLG